MVALLDVKRDVPLLIRAVDLCYVAIHDESLHAVKLEGGARVSNLI